MNRTLFLMLPMVFCQCADFREQATPEQAGWRLAARRPDTYCPPGCTIPWKAGPGEWQGEFIHDATGETRYYVPPASPELRRQAQAWRRQSLRKSATGAEPGHATCHFLRRSTLSTALLLGGLGGIGPSDTYSETFKDIWTQDDDSGRSRR